MLSAALHPAVWRAQHLATQLYPTVSSGHPLLDQELPGQGWPVGSLIELIPRHPGASGELSLLQRCLQGQGPNKLVCLLAPPHPPCIQAWQHHGLQHRLLWLATQHTPDTCWAASQILRHHQHAVLLCWFRQAAPYAQLRQLHVLARQTQNLLFVVFPAQHAQQPSPAPLRLLYHTHAAPKSSHWGLKLRILKRTGHPLERDLYLPLWQQPNYPSNHATALPGFSSHVPVPQPVSCLQQ